MDNHFADTLVEFGYITLAQLDSALELEKRWKVPLPDILTAKGFIAPNAIAKAYARQFDLKVVNLLEELPDESLLKPEMIDSYLGQQILPWRIENEKMMVVVVSPGPETILKVRSLYGQDCTIALTTRFDINWTVQRVFESKFTEIALNELAAADPENSAKPTFIAKQLGALAAIICFIMAGIIIAPTVTLIMLNVLTAIFFLGNFFFKTLLVWMGGRDTPIKQILPIQIAEMDDAALPVYTILVPMFKDGEVLPILVGALRKMDYPIAKLDIKLVLEAGDNETIEAARALGLESVFEIIRVPPSQPQTKPKACNYALSFARGDYLVIYDAEDKPEPDQLKKVLLEFRRGDNNLICIQARLNYFNAFENWLTRMFTLDYSLWFDLMLPGLEKLKIPIPLGGTSNHFKTDVLRSLHAWDPYNVTEDADLGVRITQKGYRVGIVDSTTFEEANCSIPNWVRQRSRWLKGYMQTWLVHMRHPVRFYRSLGFIGFFGFQFFVGGTVLAALLNPIFWGLYILWLTLPAVNFERFFPPVILYISIVNLILGNAAFIYLSILAPFKRRLYRLIPMGLTVFFYWVLLSIAGYKGLWQLIRKPFFWEKTDHGISSFSAKEIAESGV